MTALPPLAYGYLRVPHDMPDDEVGALEHGLCRHAEQLGLEFGGFFFEFDRGMATAFNALLEELKRAEARHVLVPSLRHLSAHPLLQGLRLARLESEAGAEVIALDEATLSTSD